MDVLMILSKPFPAEARHLLLSKQCRGSEFSVFGTLPSRGEKGTLPHREREEYTMYPLGPKILATVGNAGVFFPKEIPLSPPSFVPGH